MEPSWDEEKSISEEESSARYTALGLPQETVELLHDYLLACSNLYGICKVRRVLRLYNKQNPPIERETFLQFLEIVRREHQFYFIVGDEELYDGVPQPTGPFERELVAEHLLIDDIEDYEALKDAQDGKPFYQPEKDELLCYTDESYAEPNRSYHALRDFLYALPGVREAQVTELFEELTIQARLGYFDDETLTDAFKQDLRRHLRSDAEADAYLDLCSRFYDHLRLPEHRGFTPIEIRNRMN